MRLIPFLQACVGTVDASQWFFHLSLSYKSEMLIHSHYQNGKIWAAKSVTIAKPAFPQNCEPIHTLARHAYSSTDLVSALAAAYPDDVDERFAGHWCSRP